MSHKNDLKKSDMIQYDTIKSDSLTVAFLTAERATHPAWGEFTSARHDRHEEAAVQPRLNRGIDSIWFKDSFFEK